MSLIAPPLAGRQPCLHRHRRPRAARAGPGGPGEPQPKATTELDDQSIVTANRREENLQDVAVSGATLESERVQSIFDAGGDTTALAARVPGLFVESSNGRVAPRFYIRGLGNTDFDLAASQPVSVVMDEVVLENVTLKSFPIFDVERIEVLRGPQGTLFGRNTPAGIVKIDNEPADRPASPRAARSAPAAMGRWRSMPPSAGRSRKGVSGRLSVLLQRRSDFIDNGFTGEDDVYGGYTDFAARAQLLFEPTDRLSILALGQYRKLDGQSTLFRANILGPGNNELNANYDRDTVFYDAGGGNPAEYEVWGASLRAEYEFGGATLTSITAHYESEGSSRGDIDGGFGAVFLPVMGPGFIPFPSDTQDSIDLSQTTQEIRLASAGGGPFTWQVGGYYFDSDFTVLTEGFTFPPPVTVRHSNESWAVFGQVGVEVTQGVTVTAGLRYTEDDKDFEVVSGAPPNDRSVGDERISWDLAGIAEVAPDVRLYARVASGFRAPTIQGRDVAFFAPPSVATSEKIMSYEVGFKTELADRRLRLNGAVFHYRVDDPQFTAVGGAGNLVQLVNANEGRAWGFELESAFRVSRALPADRGGELQRHRDQRRHAGRRHLRPVHGDRSDRRHRRHQPRPRRRQSLPERPGLDLRRDRPLGHAGEQRRRDLRLHRLGLSGQDELLPLRIRGIRHRRPDRGRAQDRLCGARRPLGGRRLCQEHHR